MWWRDDLFIFVIFWDGSLNASSVRGRNLFSGFRRRLFRGVCRNGSRKGNLLLLNLWCLSVVIDLARVRGSNVDAGIALA